MTSAPPKLSRATQWFALAVLTMAGTGGLAVLYFFNPGTYHFYPVCMFHRLTGLNCPGCGMTRALYALLHGDILTALRDNALLVLGLVAAALRGLWLAAARQRGVAVGPWVPTIFIWPLLAIAVFFTILRNLPAFAFLSPK